eukprot:CAMPEP_0181484616 /NCGR_PEP_ID=MMETSP1110-20121109/46098_1 /TAXON_ID=174948 /ORGANISM="Symbiodinium sp., Strain CCMP421" /LENGTH=30 /DNA_ID= /DNA_START= /DNA_END= /DNA_ORIENTATION=
MPMVQKRQAQGQEVEIQGSVVASCKDAQLQ